MHNYLSDQESIGPILHICFNVYFVFCCPTTKQRQQQQQFAVHCENYKMHTNKKKNGKSETTQSAKEWNRMELRLKNVPQHTQAYNETDGWMNGMERSATKI